MLNKIIKSIELGSKNIKLIKYSKEKWANIQVSEKKKISDNFLNNFNEIQQGKGNHLPVSAFKPGGGHPLGTSKYEKKGYSPEVSMWTRPEKCIQCNRCSFICPRAAIRPFFLTEKEYKGLPYPTKARKVGKNYYLIQVSPYDCNGCYNCIEVCPKKCLSMEKADKKNFKQGGANWDYLVNLPKKNVKIPDNPTVPNSQLSCHTYCEFASTCQGCSEPVYMRLITQQFGHRMLIANSSGCSSVWGGLYPRSPFCKDPEGKGPAWARSLFENTAEYGYGMAIGNEHRREFLLSKVLEIIEDFKKNRAIDIPKDLFDLLVKWVKIYRDDAKECTNLSIQINKIFKTLENNAHYNIPILKLHNHLFEKVSHWIIGGDGWAYDIGYGGLDHVLSNNTKVNILVLDNEQYANTGGQQSKGTEHGAIARFAAQGKPTYKKNLAIHSLLYNHIFMSSIGFGINKNVLDFTLKSIVDAEKYPGPSLLLGYCNCIREQGFDTKIAMKIAQLAIDSGYWPLFRYDPSKTEKPFLLYSGEPNFKKFQEFLKTQERFEKLKRKDIKRYGRMVEEELFKDLLNKWSLLKFFEKYYNEELPKLKKNMTNLIK